MFCPKCGSENFDTNKFCKKCGRSLPARNPVAPGNHPNFVSPQPRNFVGQVLDGKYRLDAKLGSGGMGDVFRATRLLIGDVVAVKILHPHLASDPQAAERFRREAVMATKLRHRNIVGIYDVGISATNNVPYILMELAEGFTLRQILSQYRILPLDFAVTVTTQLCSALDEAHELGIVHRDIKPENIIANQTTTGWYVKVLDFGIAKLYNQGDIGLTLDGNAMGTPQYMSPEQCLGEALDARSDVYSVGIVLYEMLSGTVPFKSPTASAVAIHQVQTLPLPPTSHNSDIHPEVEAVVLRALEKVPEKRQQKASQLAKELIRAATSAFKSGSLPVPAAPMAAPEFKPEFFASDDADEDRGNKIGETFGEDVPAVVESEDVERSESEDSSLSPMSPFEMDEMPHGVIGGTEVIGAEEADIANAVTDEATVENGGGWDQTVEFQIAAQQAGLETVEVNKEESVDKLATESSEPAAFVEATDIALTENGLSDTDLAAMREPGPAEVIDGAGDAPVRVPAEGLGSDWTADAPDSSISVVGKRRRSTPKKKSNRKTIDAPLIENPKGVAVCPVADSKNEEISETESSTELAGEPSQDSTEDAGTIPSEMTGSDSIEFPLDRVDEPTPIDAPKDDLTLVFEDAAMRLDELLVDTPNAIEEIQETVPTPIEPPIINANVKADVSPGESETNSLDDPAIDFQPTQIASRKLPYVAIGVGALSVFVVLFLTVTVWYYLPTASSIAPSPDSSLTSSNPSKSIPPGMALVPGGEFMMGTDQGDVDSRPAHKVSVKPFYMDITEVTNEEYKKFVDATGHKPPSDWKRGTFPLGKARFPVVNVSWDDASDYAKWAGKRLPTEEEWEFAARGSDGRLYPWGPAWNARLVNAGPTGGIREVGKGEGKSPFGMLDMVGNAWEWTASDYLPYPGGSSLTETTGKKVMRGGCFKSDRNQATTVMRIGYPAEGDDYRNSSFRCVKDATTSSQ